MRKPLQIFVKAKKTYSLDHQWDGLCLGVDDQVRYRSTQNHLTDPYILQFILPEVEKSARSARGACIFV